VGEFDSPQSGSYFLMLNPGAGMSPILSGVNVPYSAEFLDRETNEGLVSALAGLKPKGSEPGKIIEDPKGRGVEGLLEFDTYRHNLTKATSSQDVWHYVMLLAACLFFADIFVRRVQINFDWLPPLVNRGLDKILRREGKVAPVETIDRLRSRKAAIAQQIEANRAAARFEPSPDAPAPAADALDQFTAAPPAIGKPAASQPGAGPQPEPQKEQDDYTGRLLEAKKRARKDRKDDGTM
jgi:hypothetical protein